MPVSTQLTLDRGASSGLAIALLLLPFCVDSIAFLCFLASESALLYDLLISGFDLLAVVGALVFARSGSRLLTGLYGASVWLPTVFYGVALLTCLQSGSGNQSFIAAAMRYIVWAVFLAGSMDWLRTSRGASHYGQSRLPIPSTRDGILLGVSIALAVTAVCQLLFSEELATWLNTVHTLLTPEGRINAVMTSVGMEKSFASLTLRNPIELGYIGLAFLCMALASGQSTVLVVAGLVLVVCGRSNASIIASLVVIIAHVASRSNVSRQKRGWIALAAVAFAAIFIANLPTIYLGEEGNWEDFILVMSYQRLGMLLAVPDLLDVGGIKLLFGGMPTSLSDLVENLYAAGLLPAVFEDGGAIAVFDVMWFGFLIVGGLPFILGAAKLLALGLSGRKLRNLGPAPHALFLYSLAALFLSFSSQILLSRYGLYFLCYFLAAASLSAASNKPLDANVR